MQSAAKSPLHYHRLWLLCGWILILIVVYFSLTPIMPAAATEVNDKLGHLLAYAVLSLWFAQLYQRPGWIHIAWSFILMGVALELLQGMSGYRQMSGLDMLANTLGVGLGLLLAAFGLSNVLRWVER